MRPIVLSMEGYSCFGAPVSVNFENLSLFAITGPTGAGKTSILDAVVFSLYGKNLKGSTIEQLVNKKKTSAKTELTFSVGKSVYQVRRTLDTNAKTTAHLYQKSAAGEMKALCSGSREVGKSLEDILGLSFDTFTKTVVLPQGRFSEFLTSSGKDQQNILNSLLGVDLYDKMAARAGERSKLFEKELRETSEALAALSNVSEEKLEESKEQLLRVRRDAESLQRERVRVGEQLTEARQLWNTSLALATAKSERVTLLQQEFEITGLREMLTRSSKCAPLLERARVLAQQLRRRDEKQRQLQQQEREVAAQQETQQKALLRWREISHRYEHLSADEEEIQRLEEASRQLPLYESQRAELVKLETRRGLQQSAAQQAKERMTQAQTQRSLAAQEVQRLGQLETELHVEPSLLDGCRDFLRLDKEYEVLRLQWSEEKKKLDLSKSEFQRTQALVIQKQHAHEQAQQACDLAEQALRDARDVKDAAERANMAGALRVHLQEGDACPVCLQQVAEVPEVEAAALAQAEQQLVRAEQQLQAMRKQEQLARTEFHNVEILLSGAESKQKSAEERTQEVQQQGQERSHALEQQKASVLALLQEDLVFAENAELGEVICAARYEACAVVERYEPKQRDAEERKRWRVEFELLRQRLVERQQQTPTVQKALAEAKTTIERANTLAESNEQNAIAAAAELSKIATEFMTVEERCVATEVLLVPLGFSVESLRQQTKKLIADVSKKLLQCRDSRERLIAEYQKLQADQNLLAVTLQHLQEGLQTSRNDLTQIAETVKEQEEQLLPALGALGVRLDTLASAVLSEDKQAEYARKIQEHDTARARVEGRIDDLLQKTGGRVIQQAELDALQVLQTNLDRQESALKENIGSLLKTIQEIEPNIARKKVLVMKQQELEEKYTYLTALKTDLRVDHFPAFVLDEVVRMLASEGSALLYRLSEKRYTMFARNRSFFVKDHWQDELERPISTLSGGEMFLTSLSMAVTLAEKIYTLAAHHNADNMLESLFLDEGFGTLDREALERVIYALEELQSSGRMIGVISHVDELTEQLPDRLYVEKSNKGISSVRRG